jgi:hypothetical protein
MIGLASVVDADVSLRLILTDQSPNAQTDHFEPERALFSPFSLFSNIPPVKLFALTDYIHITADIPIR